MLRKLVFLWLPLPVLAQNAALVAAANGNVTVNQTNPVTAFEWLPEGAVVRTGAKSTTTVILLNGHRFELGPNARGTIGAKGLSATAGPVKELDPIPPIPKPAPLAVATGTAAATRFRPGNMEKFAGLYPRDGTMALAGTVTLHFQKVEGAAAYQITVEDADGNQVAQEQTRSTDIAVSLQPGTRYVWRIKAMGAGGVVAQAGVRFATLSNEQMQARQAFADAVRGLPDGLALLAGVDFENGLVSEAAEGFRAALRLKPNDPDLQRALARVEAAK
jgi:hypothetical protein